MENDPAEIYLSVRQRRRFRVTRSPIAFAISGLIFAALLFFIALQDGRPKHGSITLLAGDSPLAQGTVKQLDQMSPKQLASWLGRLPTSRTEQRGGALVTFRVNPAAALPAVRRAIGAGGAEVRLREWPVSASRRLPIVRQTYRNNCETAALSMLLVADGARVDQTTLQRLLPIDGPLDPRRTGDGSLPVWGDPRKGFVGRVDGGGSAGGYGVYEPPILKLSGRYGARLKSLSGTTPTAIYRRLFSGRPVMAWVGLSDGPYMAWKTPTGRRVAGNFGEHTVVLTGISPTGLNVNDPLTGQRKQWSKAYFEVLWQRLGRRAVSI